MIRVHTGRYRDVFMRKSYDVFHDRYVEGSRTVQGWCFQLNSSSSERPPIRSSLHRTKEQAASAARQTIAALADLAKGDC